MKRVQQDRSFRLDGKPAEFSCSVEFSNLGSNSSRWAQYADISESGMKLITTRPHHAEIGAIYNLKFSLAGGTREVSRRARVVRVGSEFVIGVQFLSASDEFKQAFMQHARFVGRLTWSRPLNQISKWFTEHKLGLKVAFAAATFFVLTLSVIYLFSDDHAGRMRPWGQHYSHSRHL